MRATKRRKPTGPSGQRCGVVRRRENWKSSVAFRASSFGFVATFEHLGSSGLSGSSRPPTHHMRTIGSSRSFRPVSFGPKPADKCSRGLLRDTSQEGRRKSARSCRFQRRKGLRARGDHFFLFTALAYRHGSSPFIHTQVPLSDVWVCLCLGLWESCLLGLQRLPCFTPARVG